MSRGLHYEQDYIVGGARSTQVTPNFQLREFAGIGGTLRIHRELIAAVQVLRTAVGRSLKVESLAPAQGLGIGLEGRFVWLSGDGPDEIAGAARKLVREAWFAVVEQKSDRIYLEMPDPAKPPPIPAELALDRAILVTAGFETEGDPYLQVTGNFDGAGLSFGPLQVNLKTGTLQTLFKRFEIRDAAALPHCFGPLWTQWQQMLRLPSIAKQVAWADVLSRGSRKADFDPAWEAALQAVGSVPAFRAETLSYAYDSYGRKLIAALSWLRGLKPIPVRNFRCLAALFDLCVQQGSLDRAHTEIRRRVLSENPRDDLSLVRIAVEERGRKADAPWRADAMSRRLCILEREPVRVSQDGKVAQRDNRNLYLVRNAPVNQLEKYLI
ncbi:MAG: hypothetical protein ACT4PZ_21760 [Panacagrimonas sp.]